MSGPVKTLPFGTPARAVTKTLVPDDEFPRFHKEQRRGPLTSGPLVVGFGIPPLTDK